MSGLILNADSPVDFHMHTTYSDGILPASQMIDYLVENEFALAAVTDHDRVDKVTEIQGYAAERSLQILSGVEISTGWGDNHHDGYRADLLCYGFDPANNQLGPLLDQILQRQLDNAQLVYENLLKQGYHFPRKAEVLAKNDGHVLRGWDSMLLLREHGYANDVQSSFQMILAAGFGEFTGDLGEAIECAHASGAICMLAHPGRSGEFFTTYSTTILDSLLKRYPLDGIEVYHYTHSKSTVQEMKDYAEAKGLLIGAGSDSHGYEQRMPKKHPAAIVRRFLERLGVEVRA